MKKGLCTLILAALPFWAIAAEEKEKKRERIYAEDLLQRIVLTKSLAGSDGIAVGSGFLKLGAVREPVFGSLDARPWWFNRLGRSYHLNRKRSYNEDNVGFGIRYEFSIDGPYTETNFFENSWRGLAVSFSIGYEPFSFWVGGYRVSAGGAVGAMFYHVDHRTLFVGPGLIPTMSLRDKKNDSSLNATFLPQGRGVFGLFFARRF